MIESAIPTTKQIADMLREDGWTITCPLEFESMRAEQHGRSWIYHFSIKCTGKDSIPDKLFLKTKQDRSRESLFYSQVKGLDIPVPHCFAIRHTPCRILMEDYSETHNDACDWPTPPPQFAALELARAIAHLHLAFWHNPGPADLPDFLSSRDGYEKYIGYLRRDVEVFLTGMGGFITPEQTRFLQSVPSCLFSLWDSFWKPRLGSGKALPLIHGDLNPCNILYPRQPDGRVVVIDWEAYRRGLPATDLAMLFGLHLCPSFEDAFPYLREYHATLADVGGSSYSFNDLLEDYHAALMFELFFPIKLYSHQGIQDQTMLDNAFTALESFDASFDFYH